MKKTLLLFGLALLGGAASAQKAGTHPYDSLTNFLADKVDSYVGQVFYLKPDVAAKGNNGYGGFALKPDFDLGANGRNVFRSVPSKVPLQYVSNYQRMEGHYFRVTDVVTRPVKAFTRGGLTHFIQMTDMQTGDECYMGYEAQNPDSFRDIIVAGYYDKMRRTCIGRTYVYTGKESGYRAKYYVGLQDMDGKGQRKDIKEGSQWRCVDVAIEEGNDYQVIGILENPQYGKVYTLVSDLIYTGDRSAKFTTSADIQNAQAQAAAEQAAKDAANAARIAEGTSKFGETYGPMLARGEMKVGMTKEMCRWAFGAPFNVIMVTESGDNVEQWFYTNGRYLYFRGDTLIKFTEVAAYKDDTKYQHNSPIP